ncbi:hypothetical protein KIPB_009191 [Kipferlia bialata]|uniref:Phospholipid/glycerol acyltransferase domain-containing protein n=1 Tax=Kipferlia bialata TaxID=797122 RepID=A0A9K3D1W7_9EUKA|nr:hypothetical protein KIPB_009191 [Kipferlia bialata]|eukprot:g9191.t1
MTSTRLRHPPRAKPDTDSVESSRDTDNASAGSEADRMSTKRHRDTERVREEVSTFPGFVPPPPGAPRYVQVSKVLLGCILVPVRFIICVSIALTFCGIAQLLFIGQADSQLRGWRRAFMEPYARLCARVILFFCGYHWIHQTGSLATAESWTDILVFMAQGQGCFGFIAKAPIADAPIVGYAAKALNVVFVTRNCNKSCQTAAEELKTRMLDASLPRVIVFPEGTTTDGTVLLKYRAGAFRAGLPVQPCLIEYPHKWYTQSWDSQRFWQHMFRIMSTPHNKVSLTFMPVYTPSEEEVQDPYLYGDRVRQSMREEWNTVASRPVSLSPLTVKEKMVYTEYREGAFCWEECLERVAAIARGEACKCSDTTTQSPYGKGPPPTLQTDTAAGIDRVAVADTVLEVVE